ncbi:MAG TPA: hypothetical protein VIF34_08775 [Methylocystis sp.]|jgi:CRISPR-associated exonuclease Cas4
MSSCKTEAVDDPIPLSALQHAIYCLRQAALIHVERMWEENRFTAEGCVLHAGVDQQSRRYSRGVRRVAAMPLACRRLRLAGVADLVEFHKTPTAKRLTPSNTSAVSRSPIAPTRRSSAHRRSASKK